MKTEERRRENTESIEEKEREVIKEEAELFGCSEALIKHLRFLHRRLEFLERQHYLR